MCFKIYERNPAKFLPAPGLEQQGALDKTKTKLDIFADIDVTNDKKRYKWRNMSLYLSI